MIKIRNYAKFVYLPNVFLIVWSVDKFASSTGAKKKLLNNFLDKTAILLKENLRISPYIDEIHK